MAIYDTNVVIKCINGDEDACRLMSNDAQCVLTPTVTEEVRNYKHRVPENCEFLTYNDPPFTDPGVAVEPGVFAYAVRKTFLEPSRGRRRSWEVSKASKARFKRLCSEYKNGVIDEKDWRIVKESNILAELGIIEDNRLISNDSHITDDFCKAAYNYVMQNLDMIAGTEPEEMMIDIVPYKEAVKEVTKPVVGQWGII